MASESNFMVRRLEMLMFIYAELNEILMHGVLLMRGLIEMRHAWA